MLLKNEGGILPLRPTAGDTIAVVGEFARTPRYQGAGSSQVNPTRVDLALDELRAAVPDGVAVTFAPGFGIGRTDGDEALAAQASTVVAFLGLAAADESEGFDRTHIRLPASQTALLARLAQANPNVVVVLSNGSAVQVADWEMHARGVLECWLSGQASGGAAADLLTGVVNPSGRLAETLPLRLEDTPSYLNFPGEHGHVRYGEGVFVGYRGYDAVGRDVSYPFGHGLSYTSFRYADLRTEVTGRHEDGNLAVEVSCEITNTGDRRGKEVAQLYVVDPQSAVARPVRELKAFSNVELDAGAKATVTFVLTGRDFSYWGSETGGWVLEPGEFELAVGGSSRDLALSASIGLAAPVVRRELGRMLTLQEWLDDREGSDILRSLVGTDESGRPSGILGSEELIRMIGNFPLSTLQALPGVGLDHAMVAAAVRRMQAAQ